MTMIENLSGKHVEISEPRYFYNDLSEPRNALRRAAINGDPGKLKEAMDKVPRSKRGYEFGVALFDALDSGHVYEVILKLLLDGGADLQLYRQSDKSTRDGKIKLSESALMHAVKRRDVRVDLVKLLVEAGASVQEVDERGHSLLSIAVQHADAETVQYLIDAGAKCTRVYNHNGKSILMQACKTNHPLPDEQVKIAEAILRKGGAFEINLKAKSHHGKPDYSALMFALDCRKRGSAVNLELVKVLLKYRAAVIPVSEARLLPEDNLKAMKIIRDHMNGSQSQPEKQAEPVKHSLLRFGKR